MTIQNCRIGVIFHSYRT